MGIYNPVNLSFCGLKTVKQCKCCIVKDITSEEMAFNTAILIVVKCLIISGFQRVGDFLSSYF